jgi:membrane protease YdiL (CAAX protease family)
MLVEGLVYGALLGFVAKVLADSLPLGRMVPLAGALEGLRHGLQGLGLAVGAGIFEELVFRGLVLTGLLALLRYGLGADRVTGTVLAVLASAWLFSAYHHWGVGGEPYHAAVFAFRFWAGVALGGIFVTRGLGIAAFAHGFYDALLITWG